MKKLIIGANGKIGKIICEKSKEKNIPIKAMIRKSEQKSYFDNLGIETVIGDLEDEFAMAYQDVDSVVFTAGSGAHTGGDKTILVDLYGAMRSIDLAVEKGIKHFIMISAFRAKNPLQGPEKIRHYLVAKKLADDYLKNSSLTYTILRPGRLSNDPGTGTITTDIQSSQVSSVSRENVADCVLACFDNPAIHNKVIDLLDGDTPIEQAFQ
jgi:uncharacterized protein YbjT (DUF2867 family)